MCFCSAIMWRGVCIQSQRQNIYCFYSSLSRKGYMLTCLFIFLIVVRTCSFFAHDIDQCSAYCIKYNQLTTRLKTRLKCCAQILNKRLLTYLLTRQQRSQAEQFKGNLKCIKRRSTVCVVIRQSSCLSIIIV